MVDPHIANGAANKQLAPPRRKARAATDSYVHAQQLNVVNVIQEWLYRPMWLGKKDCFVLTSALLTRTNINYRSPALTC